MDFSLGHRLSVLGQFPTIQASLRAERRALMISLSK